MDEERQRKNEKALAHEQVTEHIVTSFNHRDGRRKAGAKRSRKQATSLQEMLEEFKETGKKTHGNIVIA